MKKIKGLLLVGFALTLHFAQAQSFAETALLFGRTQLGGSARIQAMGGTQVSLGGDYSSALSNPAGLGMYNKGEVAFTPSLNFANVSANYMDDKTKATWNNLSLPGFSIAFHKESQSDNNVGFLGGTVSVTHNQTNNFNQNISYNSANTQSSIIDYFLQQAAGYTPDQFASDGDMYNTVTELAYSNYLIGETTIWDPNGDPTQYFSHVAGNPTQTEDIKLRGNQGQWNVSYGANFNDKLFLGAGVGFASLKYSSNKKFREEFDAQPLDNMYLEENLEITGSGMNISLGGIYRPVDQLQVGFSVITPTSYQLSDNYRATMQTAWKNYEYEPGRFTNGTNVSTDLIISEYKLKTPWRLSAGATYFFGKSGFLSADIEQINYGGAKYVSNSSSYSSNDATIDNKEIKASYKSTTNVRVGGEFRYQKLRLRGGVNYMGDPLSSSTDDAEQFVIGASGGIGYRSDKFYIDFAVMNFSRSNNYRPYTISNNSPLVTYDQKNTNVMVTVGFPF
jgi:hypothetical protein